MSDDPAASTAGPTAEASAPTDPVAGTDRPAGMERAADLVLAGVHLRLGSLALARAELETLAGLDALDDAGVVDLAEARWRTGDIEGAGEAATLVLEDEDGPLVALIVAAEAAAARGRPTEARRLAAKALAAANGRIDQVFAGMPRSPAWPPDPAAPPPSPTTMFDPPPGMTPRTTRAPRTETAPARPARRPDLSPAYGAKDAQVAAATETTATIGIWGEDAADGEATLPGATDALDAGREALESGDVEAAATQLAFVLRLSSALAPAVLDLIADRQDTALAFVRGDAFRLVGREIDARRAYARAVGPASSADSTDDADITGDTAAPDAVSDPPPPEGDPT